MKDSAVVTFNIEGWDAGSLAGGDTGTGLLQRVNHAVRSLAAIGIQITAWTLFVDSGTEYDLTCSMEGALRVEEIPTSEQPRIGGISDAGSVPITHHVWRVINICGRPRTIKFGYGAQISHNVIRCETMATHGIGTWFDPEDRHLYLVSGRADPRRATSRHVCHKVGAVCGCTSRRGGGGGGAVPCNAPGTAHSPPTL